MVKDLIRSMSREIKVEKDKSTRTPSVGGGVHDSNEKECDLKSVKHMERLAQRSS